MRTGPHPRLYGVSCTFTENVPSESRVYDETSRNTVCAAAPVFVCEVSSSAVARAGVVDLTLAALVGAACTPSVVTRLNTKRELKEKARRDATASKGVGFFVSERVCSPSRRCSAGFWSAG